LVDQLSGSSDQRAEEIAMLTTDGHIATTLSPAARRALARAPLTQGLTPQELDRLAGELSEQSFLPGHRVVTEGFTGQEFFLIVEGVAAISCAAQPPIDRLGPGDFFGATAILDDGLRLATVTAETPLRCLVLANNDLDRVLVGQPVLAVNLLRELVRRFRDTVRGSRRSPAAARGALVSVG